MSSSEVMSGSKNAAVDDEVALGGSLRVSATQVVSSSSVLGLLTLLGLGPSIISIETSKFDAKQSSSSSTNIGSLTGHSIAVVLTTGSGCRPSIMRKLADNAGLLSVKFMAATTRHLPGWRTKVDF